MSVRRADQFPVAFGNRTKPGPALGSSRKRMSFSVTELIPMHTPVVVGHRV